MVERENLILERRGQVGWVTIDRPADRNSINSTLMGQIEAVLTDLERESMRAAVFIGAGETHFIGGADGTEMMLLDPPGARAFSARFQALLRRMEKSPLILTAAINGLCFGGGFEFALACDLRLASSSARLGLPEVKVGLIPGGGGTQRLPRLVGPGLAAEMILSGKLYDGPEALRLGLVHRVVEPERLAAEAEELLRPILQRPPHAVSLAKQALKAAALGSLEAGLKIESDLFGRCLEHRFFTELMVKQLKDGSLTTSSDVNDLIRRAEK